MWDGGRAAIAPRAVPPRCVPLVHPRPARPVFGAWVVPAMGSERRSGRCWRCCAWEWEAKSRVGGPLSLGLVSVEGDFPAHDVRHQLRGRGAHRRGGRGRHGVARHVRRAVLFLQDGRVRRLPPRSRRSRSKRSRCWNAANTPRARCIRLRQRPRWPRWRRAQAALGARRARGAHGLGRGVGAGLRSRSRASRLARAGCVVRPIDMLWNALPCTGCRGGRRRNWATAVSGRVAPRAGTSSRATAASCRRVDDHGNTHTVTA